MAISPQELPDVLSERELEQTVLTHLDQRSESWLDHRNRIERLDRIQRGDWWVEKPDGTSKTVKPLLENLLNSAIEETGRSAGEQEPSVRVEAATEAGVTRALTREQALLYGWQISNVRALLPSFYMHLSATGLVGVKILPDLRLAPEKRFPKFTVLDPRGILPPPGWAFGQEPEDVICVRSVKLRSLARSYPDKAAELAQRARKPIRSTEDVRVIDYYTPDRLVCAAALGKTVVVLYDEPNSTGMIPVVLGARPSADGRIRGQFDFLVHPMMTANRLMDYIAEYADQMVHAPPVKNFTGDIEVGPGGVITTPTDGNLGRLAPPQLGPDVFQVLRSLESSARRAGIIPESRQGEVHQSIISAQGIDALQGSFGTNIRVLQRVGEVVWTRANEVYLAQDRTWCDGAKSIVGYAQGGQFKTTYTPSKIIQEGEFGNIVAYGAGAGLDALNRSVRVLQWLGAGIVSKRWARENMDIPNFVRVEQQQEEEFTLDVVKGLIVAQAQQLGNAAPFAAYLAAIDEKGTPLAAVREIVAASVPSQPEAAAGVPTDPAAEALAMQKGATAEAPGALQALPRLEQLMVR